MVIMDRRVCYYLTEFRSSPKTYVLYAKTRVKGIPSEIRPYRTDVR